MLKILFMLCVLALVFAWNRDQWTVLKAAWITEVAAFVKNERGRCSSGSTTEEIR